MRQDLSLRLEQFKKQYVADEAVRSRIAEPPVKFIGDEIMELAVAALLQGENVLLSGGKATGKNILADNLAWLFRRPVYTVSFHVNTDSSTLIGTDTFTGGEVRLRYAYLIKCEEAVKDAEGNVVELRCTYDPMSGGGSSSDGRRVKGVIHWVSAADAVEAEIRLFNPLFTKEDPDDVDEGQTWEDNLNPESMVKITGYLEPSLRDIPVGQAVQFERVGYFCPDTDTTPGHPVFNRTVTLKDSWAKINK